MQLIHDKVKNVDQQKAESEAKGKAKKAKAVAVKLREHGMSELDIAKIVYGTAEGDAASNGSVGNGIVSSVDPEVYMVMARIADEAVERALSSQRKSEDTALGGIKRLFRR